MSESDLEGRKRELANRVVELAKQNVLANAYFLAPALSMLHLEYRTLDAPFATDGRALFVDADVVLSEYARTRTPPTHDLVHVLLHCLLLHPFVKDSPEFDRDAWELAGDIEVERLTAELLGPREGSRGQALGIIVGKLQGELGVPLGTERIYRALKEGKFSRERHAWQRVVAVDTPDWWNTNSHRRTHRQGKASESQDASQQSHRGGGPNKSGASRTLKTPRASSATNGQDEAGQLPQQNQGSDAEPKPPTPRERGFQEAYDKRAEVGGLDLPSEELRQEWRRAARSVHLDLTTMSSGRGAALGELSHALEVSGTSHTDLAEFLRQFGAYHEVLQVSPDEFDYVFYTYGLKLYGNMPLIENLEVSVEHRIHDFVIVIDTSASVEGEVVKRFVEETFGVLSTESLYCDQVNVHVIQCDAAVRDDVKLTSPADLDRWKAHVVLRGFGGTDFRPAFEYVDKLQERGEFTELVGLLYFTDGWGTYPVRPPGYKVAFVFYDSNHPKEAVPNWAMQLELSRAQLERG